MTGGLGVRLPSAAFSFATSMILPFNDTIPFAVRNTRAPLSGQAEASAPKAGVAPASAASRQATTPIQPLDRGNLCFKVHPYAFTLPHPVPVMSSYGIREQDVVLHWASTNIVENERTSGANDHTIRNNSDMRQVARKLPGHQIPRHEARRRAVPFDPGPIALQELLQIRNPAVIDVRIRSAEAPMPGIDSEVRAHMSSCTRT
jgi:hypothetical protein